MAGKLKNIRNISFHNFFSFSREKLADDHLFDIPASFHFSSTASVMEMVSADPIGAIRQEIRSSINQLRNLDQMLESLLKQNKFPTAVADAEEDILFSFEEKENDSLGFHEPEDVFEDIVFTLK